MLPELDNNYIETRIKEFVSSNHDVKIRDRKYRFDVYVYMEEFDIRFEFIKKSKSLAVVLFVKDDSDEAAYYKNIRCKEIEKALDMAEYFYHRSQKRTLIDLIYVLESKLKY